MTSQSIRALVVGVALVAAPLARAEEPQPMKLGGTYKVLNPSVGASSVSLTFTATIRNDGPNSVSGKIVLRHPNVMSKVWARFGDTSIAAGESVTISSSATVPKDQYDSWATTGPAVYFYSQDSRGTMKSFRIPLSAAPAQ